MSKVAPHLVPYVGPRFSRWLHRYVQCNPHALVGRSKRRERRDCLSSWHEEPICAKAVTQHELGEWLNEGNAVATAVRQYLDVERVPMPDTVLRIGQLLVKAGLADNEPYVPRPGGFADLPTLDPRHPTFRPPAPGGCTALFASGYFAEAISLLLALLDSPEPEVRAYAARFASVCWLAFADFDEIDDTIILPIQREASMRFIGDAPAEAIEEAWDRRLGFSDVAREMFSLTRVLIGERPGSVDRRAYGTDAAAIYYGALSSWRMLIDAITIRSRHDEAIALRWNSGRTPFQNYWEVIVERNDERLAPALI